MDHSVPYLWIELQSFFCVCIENVISSQDMKFDNPTGHFPWAVTAAAVQNVNSLNVILSLMAK